MFTTGINFLFFISYGPQCKWTKNYLHLLIPDAHCSQLEIIFHFSFSDALHSTPRKFRQFFFATTFYIVQNEKNASSRNMQYRPLYVCHVQRSALPSSQTACISTEHFWGELDTSPAPVNHAWAQSLLPLESHWWLWGQLVGFPEMPTVLWNAMCLCKHRVTLLKFKCWHWMKPESLLILLRNQNQQNNPQVESVGLDELKYCLWVKCYVMLWRGNRQINHLKLTDNPTASCMGLNHPELFCK